MNHLQFTPPTTPRLRLQVRYKEAETPGLWVGFVEEVRGIFMQSASVEELFKDAAEVTAHMLNHYKRADAFALLRAQGHEVADEGQEITFTLAAGPTP